jgi:hypothetical protein
LHDVVGGDEGFRVQKKSRRNQLVKNQVLVGEYKYTQEHDRENITRHMVGNNIITEQGKA